MHPADNEHDDAAGLAKLAVEAVSSAKLMAVTIDENQYVVTFGPTRAQKLEPSRVLDEFEIVLNRRQFRPTDLSRISVNFSRE